MISLGFFSGSNNLLIIAVFRLSYVLFICKISWYQVIISYKCLIVLWILCYKNIWEISNIMFWTCYSLVYCSTLICRRILSLISQIGLFYFQLQYLPLCLVMFCLLTTERDLGLFKWEVRRDWWWDLWKALKSPRLRQNEKRQILIYLSLHLLDHRYNSLGWIGWGWGLGTLFAGRFNIDIVFPLTLLWQQL